MTPPTYERIYTIAYGYNQTFELSEKEAVAMIKAREQKAEIVKFGDKVLSTNFSWLVPSDQINPDRLSLEELHIVEKVSEWLSRDVHGLDFTKKTAMEYAKKTVKRIGSGQMIRLYNEYANGAYPNARRFLSEISQNNLLEE